jgi:protein-disulfide isomerase
MAMLRDPITSVDHTQGPNNAPVTLLEYGDYQCPYCGMAYPIIKRVQRQFATKLRFVFRHFPLTEIHPYAKTAAESAECAGAHGRFWEMHDLLYENQDRLGLPLILSAVRSLGLSEQSLRDALATGAYAPKVRRDFLSGIRSGVRGTPTLFLDGQRYEGAVDYASLTAAITDRLALDLIPA